MAVAAAGCIIPGVPGPPLAFAGYLLMLCTPATAGMPWWAIAILGVLTLFTVIADLVMPMIGVKMLGGTKWGNWGCLAGAVIGLFFMPYGIILGPFIGALIFELIATKHLGRAFASALGSTVGFVLGTGLKLFVVLLIAIAAVIALIV